jgi:hypothetical protein
MRMADLFLGYLDPGTGATLVQLALAGTAGIAAAGKLRMNKIKRRLAREAEAGAEISEVAEQQNLQDPTEESASAQ